MAVAAVFGKILQVVGGLAQNRANFEDMLGRADKFKFDASVAERNAELARQDQVLAVEAGKVERANITKSENVTRGEARTEYAAGNVELDTGTPLEYDIAVAEQAATERSRSKDDEMVRVARLETERKGLLSEATMLRRASKRTRNSARMGNYGGALSTIGGAMSSFGGK